MDIIKVCILILASIFIGMFLAGILITFAFRNARIERYEGKDLDLITLAKFKIEDEITYLVNDKNFWNGIELTFYFMFGKLFYKSSLIWRKEKRTKIYFTIATIFLILILVFAIIY